MVPVKMTDREISALVDELGPIDARIKAVAGDVKRADEIKKALRGCLDNAPAEATRSFSGAKYTAMVSERRMEKTVNVVRLCKQIGARAFLKLAVVTLKALEETLPLQKRAGLVEEARTGSRVVTTALKSTEQLAKAA